MSRKSFPFENITKLSRRLLNVRSQRRHSKWYHQPQVFSLHERLLCDTPAELFIETKTMFELQLWQGIFHGLCFQLQEQIRSERDALFYFPHEFLIADRKTFRPIFPTEALPAPQQAEVLQNFPLQPEKPLKMLLKLISHKHVCKIRRIAISSHEYFSSLENYSNVGNVIDNAEA